MIERGMYKHPHPETSTSIIHPNMHTLVGFMAKVEIKNSSGSGENDSESHTGICEKAAVVEP